MRIAVVGVGYVGLPLGAALAESGNFVYCVDLNKEKIDKLNQGKVPIYEPGLQELIEKSFAKNLFFTIDVEKAIQDTDIIFIAVGTPSDKDGSADLKYVLSVAEAIGKNINGYKIVIDKSTVPVGTAKKVKAKIQEQIDKRGELIEFDVVSNPEFMCEGTAVDDILKPDRVVIGTDNERVALILKELYEPFVLNGNPIIITTIESAEMIKYAANCFLAMKISFINEMSDICEKVGANIEDIRKGIGSDTRIGNKFLYPSPKYGGSCFPKDTLALFKTSQELGIPSKMIQASIQVNDNRVKNLCNKIFDDKQLETITLWGLAFKAETDDIRESAALDFINYFLEKGIKINVYDPMANENIYKIYTDKVNYFDDQYDALDKSDFLIIVTEWKQFRNPDFDMIKKYMKTKSIFDARNLFNPKKVKQLGFEYFSLGR